MHTRVTEERWETAQKSEGEYWSSWKLLVSEKFKAVVEEYWDHYLRLIKKYVKLQGRILDIGCGPDGMINHIDQAERFGLDPLMDYYLSDFKMPKSIRWRKGVGESIPFENEYFDLVITTNTLDHTQQPEKMLEEVYRVLRKGGHLFLSVNCYGPISLLGRRIFEKLRIDSTWHPFSFSFSQVQHLLTKLKFNVLVSGLGIGCLGKYVSKKLQLGREKTWTFQTRPKLILTIGKAAYWIDERSGYPATDCLFLALKT